MKYMGMLALWCMCTCAMGQSPSWPITLQQAENRFLQKNLLLLADRYEIDRSSALAYQQTLFNNPEFESDWAIHGSNNKWLDVGQRGQKAFSIDQLIELAGKRKKRVQLTNAETEDARLNFEQTLRQLRFELRDQFYQLAYAHELLGLYDEQIGWLDKIILAYDEQASLRNVTLKDVVRLKSERIQLLAQKTEVANRRIESDRSLQWMLDTTVRLLPQKPHNPDQIYLPPTKDLIDSALAHRPDLLLVANEREKAAINLSLQKAMATPDIRVGAAYDQQGNYTNNFYSLRFAMPLPLFNRNQGNVRAARVQVTTAELRENYYQSEIIKQVNAAIDKVKLAEQSYQESLHFFDNDFPTVNHAVLDNFNKGNITILEFLDFFENYNETIRQMNELHRQRRMAYEELEYTVGIPIFHPSTK